MVAVTVVLAVAGLGVGVGPASADYATFSTSRACEAGRKAAVKSGHVVGKCQFDVVRRNWFFYYELI